MIKMTKLSIIIPAFNEEALIEQALLSLKAQDYPDLETIVVDNGSTDSTRDIAEKHADLVLPYDEKQSPSAARNYGAVNSNGEYVAFLDADSCLSIAVKHLDQGFAGGTCRLIPPEDKLAAKVQTAILNNWARFIGPQYTPFIYTSRQNFDKVDGWNEELGLGDELDLQRKLGKLGKMKFDSDSYVTTSPRRYQEKGYFKTTLLGVLGYYGFKIKWEPVRK